MGDDQRAVLTAAFFLGKDLVFSEECLLFLPSPCVFGIEEHAAVFPVIGDAGVVVLEGEVG